MSGGSGTDTRVRWPERGFLARHATALVITLGLAVAVAVVVLLGGGARTGTPLDPDNPGPGGAQALARVLEDQGVDLTVARDAEALEAAEVPDTTVVVTSTELLGESTTGRLLAHTRGALLVLVDPAPGLVDLIGPFEAPSRVTQDGGWQAACSDPLFADLTVEADRALAYPADGCFRDEDGSLVVQNGDVMLFGASQALTNDQILRADNAAAAVRLLGQHDRLVWYVPTIDDLPAGDGVSLETLIPRWIGPGLWLGALAAVALVVWRARRLGPLATEPLPVVVKAIETTQARGRLYRKARDRPHAAEALRQASRTRAATRLGLTGPTDPLLVSEVARHTGRDQDEVAALLGPDTPPRNDQDLITLARRLAELDREVRRT
ncbi:MAG TPA: DUF4350 domain-containing protein [Nocardioides sp.]|nr:DUF4350 domain-containing protein [Nocardioides sp.]